jgi:hypothetical protein
MKFEQQSAIALNAVCPYFTMFPLAFPRGVLARHAQPKERVLDPFCGRGTTVLAARLQGLESMGIDSNPVAAAIATSKLARATVSDVLETANEILGEIRGAPTPEGEFWDLAYHPSVLRRLARLRLGLLHDCSTDSRKLLRATILGALHGPLQKTIDGYFSNQSTRTYAPKPAYAVKYWRKCRLRARNVDVLGVIEHRVTRILVQRIPSPKGRVILGDSRNGDVVSQGAAHRRFDWVITSPPYYGMRTYVPDQWLRNWFLGGPDWVDYKQDGQLDHLSQHTFAEQIGKVWRNAAGVCNDGARMVIRFGAIADRKVDPVELFKQSLAGAGWRLKTVKGAGRADAGKRQADAFLRKRSKPSEEFDFWLRLE